jgi:hypothetical protein
MKSTVSNTVATESGLKRDLKTLMRKKKLKTLPHLWMESLTGWILNMDPINHQMRRRAKEPVLLISSLLFPILRLDQFSIHINRWATLSTISPSQVRILNLQEVVKNLSRMKAQSTNFPKQ